MISTSVCVPPIVIIIMKIKLHADAIFFSVSYWSNNSIFANLFLQESLEDSSPVRGNNTKILHTIRLFEQVSSSAR